MIPPNNRPELWSAEQLERAALDEAARHGANNRDLDLLRQQFKKAAEINQPQPSGLEIPNDQEKGRQWQAGGLKSGTLGE
jgi:hypothetical protein